MWSRASLVSLAMLTGLMSLASTATAQVETTTTLAVPAGNFGAGQTVMLTANVSGNNPTGTVTLYEGTAPIGSSVPLNNGSALVPYTSTAPANHSIYAQYSGDTSNGASTSSTQTLTLNGRYYYISAQSGSDAAPGTQQQPWATFTNIVPQTPPAGQQGTGPLGASDRIMLKCGDTWYNQRLSMNSAFLAPGNSSITITGWGNCAAQNAVIDASQAVPASGWVGSNGSPLYTYQFPTPYPAQVSRLFMYSNGIGTALPEAQYPASGNALIAVSSSPSSPTAPATLLYTQSADDQVFQSEITALGSQALVGALAHVHTAIYRVEDLSVASYTMTQVSGAAGQINFSQSTSLGPQAGFGYTLSGKSWMIKAAGQWAYDASTGVLSLYPPTGVNPSSSSVAFEASPSYSNSAQYGKNFGIWTNGIALNLSHVTVLNASWDGIEIDSGSNSTVSNCAVGYSGRNGIGVDLNNGQTTRTTGMAITQSTVTDSRSNGIYFNYVVSPTVTQNVVLNTGTGGAMRDSGAGIYEMGGQGGNISYNFVDNSAASGINFTESVGQGNQALQIWANLVTRSCTLFDDCGGIYTFNNAGTDSSGRPIPRAGQNALIGYNYIGRVQGGVQGTNETQPLYTAGIYLDNQTQNVVVQHNSIWDAETGLNLHFNSNITATQNQVNLFSHACLNTTNDSGMPANQMVITDNSCLAAGNFGVQSDASDYSLSSPAGGAAHGTAAALILADANQVNFGNFSISGNSYQSLYGPSYVSVWGISGRQNMDIATWTQQPQGTMDNQVAEPPFKLNAYNWTSLGGTLVTNGAPSFNGYWYPNWGNGSAGTFDYASGSNCGSSSSSTQCFELISANPGGTYTTPDLLLSPGLGALQAGQPYLLQFDALTPNSTQNPTWDEFGVLINQNGGSYGYMGVNSTISALNSGWNHYQFVFNAVNPSSSQTMPQGRLSFNAVPQGQTLRVKNVSVSPITGLQLYTPGSATYAVLQSSGNANVTPGSDDILVLVNPQNASSTLTQCPASDQTRCNSYVGLDGAQVAFGAGVTVPAQQSKVLVWAGSAHYQAQR